MAKSIAFVMIAVVVMAAGLGAQQKPTPKPAPQPAPKPNFTGRWVIVSPAKGAGEEQTVTQDDKTLTTEHAAEGPAHKMVYQLDGVERRQALPSHGREITILAKAAWDGDRIVITTHATYPNGMKTDSKEIWSLDKQGRLVIDFTESGPTGPLPAEKVIYTKKKSPAPVF